MENLGSLAILLAFCVAIYATLASLVGRVKRKPFLIVSGERAVYSIWVLMTIASGVLVYSLLTGDFRMSYVAEHSNRTMPILYKFAAWWGGQEGSLLFWSWLLSTYAAVVVFTNRRKHRDMMPWVIGVMTTVQSFFLVLNNFIANPFRVLAQEKLIVNVGDGNGLSPLLQYPAMAIHPPMLYLGYVGFCVPFAFAIGSLITRQPGDAWIHTTRRWTLVTWLFQSTGIMLGAAWAYHVLGWGGYWGWDPVENASLLPWLSGTAFLHSVMMQEKKGMMKVWNIVLVSTTFFLCIFGTFLTRSGVVSSVHAFAQGSIGKFFVTFLAIGIAGTVYLILNRLDFLKSEAQLESVLSRESSFLFNNLVLLASCFAVLWGTLFPVISEAVTGEKISVDAPFYNRVQVPIGLFMLFLTGVGPLIAWRRSSFESLRKSFLWPTVAAVGVAAVLAVSGIHHFYALMSFGLSAFVLISVGLEFVKGASAISSKSGTNILTAMVELTHRNTRRYGGYLVHVGIVLIFIAFTGKAFDKDAVQEVTPGGTMQIGRYALHVVSFDQGQNENYQWGKLNIDVSKDGDDLGKIEPEHRLYRASKSATSEVAIRRRLNEDLYVNFAGTSPDGQKVIIQAYVFPLVTWIWVGYWVVLIGTLVCLVPNKQKLIWARTEVVGIADKHAKAQN